MRSASFTGVLGVLLALWLPGCVPTAAVERAYDGYVWLGRSVDAAAYASYARGVLAELDGRRDDAIAAYREVLRMDSGSGEARIRLGALECARDFGGPAGSSKAPHVQSMAEEFVPTDASAPGPTERCSASVGISAGDPARHRGRDERASIVARSLAGAAGGWSAVAAWAETQRDVALNVYAQARLVRQSVLWRPRAVATAQRLAGQGEVGAARTLAGAIVDAGGGPLSDADVERIGRLAVDDAIVAGDVALARARATHARIGLEEVAARALLASRPGVARGLALERLGAEPETLGARLVAACVEGSELLGDWETQGPANGPVSAAAFVAYGAALVEASPPAEARVLLERIPHANPSGGDDLVVREATELAALGVLSAGALPPDGLVELAARYGSLPPPSWSNAALDARHRYLALALTRPGASETAALGALLSVSASRDPIVAAAAAWVSLATGRVIGAADAKALLAQDASDRLLASVALRLARRAGDGQAVADALAALGR